MKLALAFLCGFLIVLDYHFYFSTAVYKRRTWPWWSALPGGAIIAWYLY